MSTEMSVYRDIKSHRTLMSKSPSWFFPSQSFLMNILGFFVTSPIPQMVSCGFVSTSMSSPVPRRYRRRYKISLNLANSPVCTPITVASSDDGRLLMHLIWAGSSFVMISSSIPLFGALFVATEASVVNVKWEWIQVWKWTIHSEKNPVMFPLLVVPAALFRSPGSIWRSSIWYLSVSTCNLWRYNSFGLPFYCGTDSVKLCTVCRTCRFLYVVGGYMGLIYCTYVISYLRSFHVSFRSFIRWNLATIGRALEWVYCPTRNTYWYVRLSVLIVSFFQYLDDQVLTNVKANDL